MCNKAAKQLAGFKRKKDRGQRVDNILRDPKLSKFAGRVSDSGEGRWTVEAAVEAGVPAHVLSSALFERFSSRGESDYADKVLSAMRDAFGGHREKS